jgi:ribosomal protein L11 methyltransferase
MNLKCPYDELYVYVLSGEVEKDDEPLLGERFLGNWIEEGMSVLFFSAPAGRELARLTSLRPQLTVSEEHTFTYEQWQGVFGSMRIGDFFICTPWYDGPREDPSRSIVLDPGLVFGNGLHPTTRDCIEALCWLWESRSPKAVLDLGTGSGILALVAARLGAKRVTAIDLNRLCVETASRNVALNGLDASIDVMEGPAASLVERKADLIVANVHFPVIKEFLEARALRKGELYVLSGLMRSQTSELLGLMDQLGLTVLRRWDAEMTWFTIAAISERGGDV